MSVKQIASGLVQAGIPVHFVSGSAGGKTSFIRLMAKSLDSHLIRISLGPREPTDLHGFMIHVKDDELKFGKPPHMLELKKAIADGKNIIFHLDEFDSCQPTLQVAVLDLVGDYLLGDMQLPHDRVSFIATGNPVSKAANGHQLADALFKRFINMPWSVDLDDWLAGLMSDFSHEDLQRLPSDWRQYRDRNKQLVAAFLKAKPSNRDSQQEPESETDSKPNQRAWSWFVVDAMSVADAMGWPDEWRAAVVIGAVGQAAGVEFMAYIKAIDLPNPVDVLTNPAFPLPKNRPDIMFTILHSCVSLACEHIKYWDACKLLISRAALEGSKDLSFSAFRRMADYYNGHLNEGKLSSIADVIRENPEFGKFIRIAARSGQ